MRAVLVSFYRRWWWVFALVAIFQMLMVGATLSGRRTIALFYPVFCGSFLLLMDAQRGMIRALAPLPIGRAEMAGRFWLATVPFPALVTVLLLGLGQFGYSLFTPKALPGVSWLLFNGVISFLICGTMFYAFTGLANGPGSGSAGQLRSAYYGLIWGVSCGGSVILSMTLKRDEIMAGMTGGILLVLTLLATWLGWREREAMIGHKGGAAGVGKGTTGKLSAETSKCPRGFGGLPFLLANMVRSYAFFAAIMLGGLFVFGGIMLLNKAPMHPFDVGKHLLAGQNPGAVGIWLAINAVALAPAAQIRALRTLPLRPLTITALLSGLPLIASCMTGLLMFGLATLSSAPAPVLGGLNCAAQSALLFSLGVPVLLRWGFSPVTFGALFALLPILVLLSLPGLGWVSREVFLPLAVLITVPVCAVITHRLVLRGSAPYRGDLLHMPGWQPRA